MNSSDFSVTWAYTRGSLYTGSFGSQGFRGAYTRVGLYAGGLILGVIRYAITYFCYCTDCMKQLLALLSSVYKQTLSLSLIVVVTLRYADINGGHDELPFR